MYAAGSGSQMFIRGTTAPVFVRVEAPRLRLQTCDVRPVFPCKAAG